MSMYAKVIYNDTSESYNQVSLTHLVGPFNNREDLMKWYNSLGFASKGVKKIEGVDASLLDHLLSTSHRLIIDNIKFGWQQEY